VFAQDRLHHRIAAVALTRFPIKVALILWFVCKPIPVAL